MPFGYNGKILHINLTDSSWEIEEPHENWYRTYVGGTAPASRISTFPLLIYK